MKKALITLIFSVLTLIILLFIFQHSVYADVIVDEDILNLLKNKDNTSTSNPTYSNTTNNNNTIAPKLPNIEKDNNILPTFLIAGGLVIIAVGTSIIVLNKSKNKNGHKQ